MKRALSLLVALVMIFTLLPHQVFAAEAEAGEALPIHFFLASPGNITNPNGSYVNYYGPSGSDRDWDGAWTIPNIKQDANWNTMYTQNGIRNVTDESIVTQYVASYPHGHSAASFKDFGSVTINGTVYRDTEYEIKWVSIMCRDNTLNDRGMNCNQYSYKDEHIHVDGLLVKKVEPGEMEVFKAIPETAVSQTTATSFHFKLEKMLQDSLTTPPTSATAVDPSFTPLTLTATIPAGSTEAQITGGSEITFGYYKLTEIPNELWNMTGIALTSSSGRTQTVAADALYICIAPNGTVQYSTAASGPYTAMNHVAVQNERKAVTVTYQWRIYDGSGVFSEVLPGTLGAHSVPAPVTGVAIGSEFTYNTGFTEGTTYHDYENGLLYTFHGWDTYSHSSIFEVDPSVTGYEALDDGDKDASNNKKIPITANTWINGYWSVSPLEAADAYLMVHKDVVVSSGDADYVNDYLQNTGKMFIQIDPGIDLNQDGNSQIDADYPGVTAEGGYLINVYQYEKDFIFTEKQADVPGYTRAVSVTVTPNSNLSLVSIQGDTATVHIEEEYNPDQAPYNLGTVTFTNTYTKNVGVPVTEYPTLTLIKRATDTGNLQAGAEFTLYSDEACTVALTTVTTDAAGEAVIDFESILKENGNIGTLYLKETAAPEGYLVNEAVYTLTLTKSEQEILRGDAFVMVTSYALAISVPADSGAEPVQSLSDALHYQLNVANDPIRGTLTVVKESEGLAESDKSFLAAFVTIHGPITRDESGKITALGGTYMLTLDQDNEWTAVQGNLPIGEYLIHENAATIHGYTWDMENIDYGNLKQEDYNGITSAVFEVSAEDTELSVTITNTYKVWEAASFEIHKIAPGGAGLGGATFVLYSDEACTNAVQTHTTAANGYAYFGGLTVPSEEQDGIATYYLKETAAPAGYYLSDTVYKVEIKAVTVNGVTSYETKISVKDDSGWVESSDFVSSTDTLTVVNEPVKGQITIIKQMLGAPEDLTSVSFYVTGPGGYAKTVTLTAEENWSVTLTDLALGEYTIIESEADVPGYSLITTYSVNGGEATTDKAVVVLAEADAGSTLARTVIAGLVDITNSYTRNEELFEVPTALTVKKVGEKGEALSGAVFTLERLSADGRTVIRTVSFTTGADGTVVFDLLTGFIREGETIDGTYILTETEAPAGYQKTDTSWIVTITEDDDGQIRWELNENENVFEGFWEWIVGDVEEGTFENGVLTVTNRKKLGSLTVSKAVTDPNGLYTDATYSFTLDFSDNTFDRTFTLKAGQSVTIDSIPWGTTYTLTEDTTGAAFTGVINNEGNGRIWADATRIQVTNTYAYTTHTAPLTLVKVDADDNTKVIAGAGFTLYADKNLKTKIGKEVFSDENGKVTLPIAGPGTYYLAETTTPEGYHGNPAVYVVTAEEKTEVKNAGTAHAVTEIQLHIRIEGLTGTTENRIDYTYPIENTAIKTVAVHVEKVWNDGGYYARPEAVVVTLYRNGEAFETVTLTALTQWSHTWEGLTDEYTWTVDEDTVAEGYTKTVTADGYDFTVTNTREAGTVNVSAEKIWFGAGVEHPESVRITLYRNGEAYESVTLSADNGWRHTWKGLSDVYEWSVDEPSVPSGYNKTVRRSGNSFTITNTHEDNPHTGDLADLAGMGTLTAIGAVGFGVSALALLLPSKKKKEEEQ